MSNTKNIKATLHQVYCWHDENTLPAYTYVFNIDLSEIFKLTGNQENIDNIYIKNDKLFVDIKTSEST